MGLLVALFLLPSKTFAAPQTFEKQVVQASQQIGEQAQNEDADEDSFGIDGNEPLPNFHQVSTGVYRSGQPNREGLAELRDLGVRTILDLREKVGNDERAEARRLGIEVVHVGMNGIFSPSFSEVDRAIKVLTDPKLAPVLVHCRYGKDRTGATVASLRTAIQKMPVPQAADEAHQYGCCAPMFKPLEPYLESYLKHRAGKEE